MRVSLGFLALAVAAAGCGKQLNPEYCTDHQTDPDCAASFVALDAAPPCASDTDCAEDGKRVCDTKLHACVQCAGSDDAACTGTDVCSASDTCVGCNVDADCASGVCFVASNMCADSATLLYASPTGMTTGTCTTQGTACTLAFAASIADATHHIIQLAAGTYNLTAKLELAVEGLHLVAATPLTPPTITTGSGTVLHVTKSVELDNLDISGTNDDIIVCDGTDGAKPNLVLEQVSVHGSSRDSINSNKCNVTIERSRIYANKQTGAWIDDGVVNIRNSFIFNNGATNYEYAAVVFRGSTTGKLLFNTISYNTGYDQEIGFGPHKTHIQDPSSLDCDQDNGSSVAVTGNLFIEDGAIAVRYSHCSGNYTTDNLIGVANDAAFANPPADLHLTGATPSGNNKVRDDGNSNCADDGTDIDGQARPQNNACDYGADEYAPTTQ